MRATSPTQKGLAARGDPTAALFLVMAIMGCTPPGAALFQTHPELRPRHTTWEGLEQSTTRSPVSMDDYGDLIARVTTKSPRALAAWHAWTVSIEAAGTAAALPLPRLRYTAPFAARDGSGPMEHLLELEQTIPSPISLSARRNAGLARVEEARWRYESVVLDVITDLTELLAEVRFIQQAILATRVNEELATQLATAADGLFARDAGTLFDSSRARSQLAQLKVDRIRFDELLVATTGQVSALLDLPTHLVLGPLAPWPLGTEPSSLESLCRAALEHQPELRAVDAEIVAAIEGVHEARGQWWPELMVGVMWRGGRAEEFGMGTPDELGLMLGLELPLWRTVETGTIAGAEAMLAEKATEKQAMLRSMVADIQYAWLLGRNARRLLVLYDETLLPEARRSMGNANAWQVARSAGFSDFLEARSSFYSFTIARERAYADAVKAEARLRRWVGGTIGDAP
ncbi:MAG: TolC family protein [Myxococcales bacterium]|nr:TolC family protein [Myxococcales bacterium]